MDEFYSHYYYDGDSVDPADGGVDVSQPCIAQCVPFIIVLISWCQCQLMMLYIIFFYTLVSKDNSNWPKTVSSAKYVDDVDQDPILIVNGLTKNWRCPGFRVCWIVAPKDIVSMLGSAGSYLDGGANAPLQRLALPLMELDFIRKDAWALQRHFRAKRDFLLEKLPALGIKVQWST